MILSGARTVAEEEIPPLQPPSSESLKEGYEIKDANVFALTLGALSIVLGAFFLQWGLGSAFSYFKREKLVEGQSQGIPPADFLEASNPEKGLSDYQEKVHQILTTYDWIDREKKIVRIPIEKAMERMSHGK